MIVKAKVQAYCAQFEKRSPKPDDNYEISFDDLKFHLHLARKLISSVNAYKPIIGFVFRELSDEEIAEDWEIFNKEYVEWLDSIDWMDKPKQSFRSKIITFAKKLIGK